MPVMLMVLAAAYGAAAGLLIPRPVHRMAVGPEEGWRVACPGGHPIGGPARGWLGQGRCAEPGCGAYGPGTVPTAAVTALVCAALAAVAGARPELAVWLLMAPVAVLLAAVDRRVHRLPDELTLPLAVVAAGALGLVTWLPGESGASWPRALLGGLALGAFYLLLFVVNPTGIGLGDVKLAIGLGIALGWYGWRTVVTGGAAGILIGALYGAVLMCARRGGPKVMPLGPFMIIGAFGGLLLGAAATA
ncbi:A24 family peptidase [Streptomyces sp. NPDC048483]|uniref:A24 family peptidase n=1 Tax=Streptomyces sp. NPDC048483 TaxID=3154927 RepID=UPI00341E9951